MEDLSLHILDIAENAITAGASAIAIEISEDTSLDRLVVEVADNGRGMEAAAVKNALDPFFTTRTTRRVGLGLSLLGEAARLANGELTIRSAPESGTVVRATFQHSHVDRQPLGDVAATFTTLVARCPDLTYVFNHRRDTQAYSFKTDELRRQLEGIPLNSAAVLGYLLKFLSQEEATLDHKA